MGMGRGVPTHRGAVKTGVVHHCAVSVDIDRFSDTKLSRDWLACFKPLGVTTPADIRRLCGDARAKGLEVFPPCDHVDERGFCKGHLA